MIFFCIMFLCFPWFGKAYSFSSRNLMEVSSSIQKTNTNELKEFFIKQFPKNLGNGHYHSVANYTLERRNHDCQVINNQVILISGRFQPTMEIIDPSLGNAPHQIIRNATFFDLNHVHTVVVDPLNEADAHNYEWEIWNMCGFHGDVLKTEVPTTKARIIRKKRNPMLGDSHPYELIMGPKLPYASGSCASGLLKLDGPEKPGHVCIFGGSNGTHAHGRFHRYVSCYDRAKQKWNMITHIPVSIDHHSMVKVPEIQCPGNGTIGPYIFIFHGRTKSWGKAIDVVYAWKLPRDENKQNSPADYMASFKNATWETFAVGDDYPRDASASIITEDGRYVIAFGGLTHGMKQDRASHTRSRRIRVLDICTRKWHTSKIELSHPRLSIQACRNGRYPLICGGTYEEPLTLEPLINQNLASCELFDTDEIVKNLLY